MCVDKNSSEWEEPQQNEEVKKCELEICILHSTAWAHPFIHEHEKCLIIHMVMIQERTTDTKYFKSSLTPIHHLSGLPSDESFLNRAPSWTGCHAAERSVCMCCIQTAYVYMHIQEYLHIHMGCWSKGRCSVRVRLGSVNLRLQLSCTVRSLLSLHWDKLCLLSFLCSECLL